MNENKKNNRLADNIIWNLSEKWACQIVNFIISIIIARILEPEAYGIVAIVNAFISIFSIFINNGSNYYLVQNKNSDDLDFCTAFYSNVVLCSVVYLILFVSAPLIAKYYNMESLTNLLRASGIVVLISSIKNIEHAYVTKEFIFKKFFFASLFGTIGSGIIGILLAIKGFGAWALVISTLFDTIIDTIFIWFVIDWRPKLLFSFSRLKKIYDVGWKISLSAIINRISNKCYHLIIGKYYSSDNLAYYDKGSNLTGRVAENLDQAIVSVLFPFLSKRSDDKNKIKSIAKKCICVNFYIMSPILLGLYATSDLLVSILLTDKWLGAVPYIRVFCLINILLPFQTINQSVVKSLGHSEIYLKQQTLKQIISILILIISVKYGVYIIAIGKLLSSIIEMVINSYPNKRLIDYSLFEQIKDIFSTIVINVLMVLSVNLFSYIKASKIVLLIIKVIVGVATYIILSLITNNNAFYYLLDNIKTRAKARTHHK